MGAITNRMLPLDVTCTDAKSTVLWGNEDDAALNGGTRFSATITNPDAANLVVTILVKSTIDSPFVPNTTTVTCSTGDTRIDVTDLVGWGARLTGKFAAGPAKPDITVSVQVQQ